MPASNTEPADPTETLRTVLDRIDVEARTALALARSHDTQIDWEELHAASVNRILESVHQAQLDLEKGETSTQ